MEASVSLRKMKMNNTERRAASTATPAHVSTKRRVEKASVRRQCTTESYIGICSQDEKSNSNYTDTMARRDNEIGGTNEL